MKVLEIHCPNCGGNIKLDDNSKRNHCFCLYCGQQIILDDEVKRTEHTEITRDEARIKEADVEAQIELEKLRLYNKELDQYEERKRKRIKLAIGWGAVLFADILVATIFNLITWDEIAGVFGVFASIWLLVGLWGLLIPSVNDEKPKMPQARKKRK